MERNVRMEDISDGKLYNSNDMVKADCGGCIGCSHCCRVMVDTIILDPWDLFHLMQKLNCTVETLLQDKIELNVVDGIILPNLKSNGDGCGFLDANGRCQVHDARPGFCRLFPLGRYYENRSFKYFLQTHECTKENRTKIKIKKWLGIPDLARYEQYICDWHYFLKDVQKKIEASSDSYSNFAKEANMLILQIFFMTPYNIQEDFYPQFEARLRVVSEQLHLIN